MQITTLVQFSEFFKSASMTEATFRQYEENQLAVLAALAPEFVALGAWKQLMGNIPFDEVNVNTQRLAPAIFCNLRGVRDFPERERLRGTYKYTWTKTTRLIHSLDPVFRALNDADLNFRVIKGLAIQLLLNSVGSRTMGDIDLLFSSRDIQRAVEIVESLGFRRTEDVPCSGHSSNSHFLGLNYSLGETHLDLHVAETKYPQKLLVIMLDQPTNSVRCGSSTVKIPSHESLFLHAVVHGDLTAGPTDFIQAISDVGRLQKFVDLRQASLLAKQANIEASIVRFQNSTSESGFSTLQLQLPETPRSRTHRIQALRNRILQDTNSRTLLRRIQARRVGRTISVDTENQHSLSRLLYRLWMYTGQIAIVERYIYKVCGGMLRKSSTPVFDGLSIAPFQSGSSHPALTALRVAGATIDWRFRIQVPENSTKLLIKVRAEALAKLDLWAFVNGSQLCRLIGGDPTTHILTIHNPAHNLEISLRPVWSACHLCFAGFNAMELEFTLQGGSVGA